MVDKLFANELANRPMEATIEPKIMVGPGPTFLITPVSTIPVNGKIFRSKFYFTHRQIHIQLLQCRHKYFNYVMLWMLERFNINIYRTIWQIVFKLYRMITLVGSNDHFAFGWWCLGQCFSNSFWTSKMAIKNFFRK